MRLSTVFSGASFTQTENITIEADNTSPAISLDHPLNQGFYKDEVVITGSLFDPNLT